MYSLPLNKLIKYNTEYAEFFGDPPALELPVVDVYRCNVVLPPLGEFSVTISDRESEGWTLFKNSEKKTYLLIHLVTAERKWNAYFAPDPTDVLPALKAVIGSWKELFPLIRKAHEASHPTDLKDPPDFKFLERLITEAYHHIGGDFLRQRIQNTERLAGFSAIS